MRKSIIFTILIILVMFSDIPPAYAADPTTMPASGIGCGGGFGPIGELLCPEKNPTGETVGIRLNSVLGSIVGFLTVVAGLWFIFQFIVAGYQWINSAGDKTALETARKKIYHALIGILIVTSAWVIIALFSKILGLDILNPGEIIQNLGL